MKGTNSSVPMVALRGMRILASGNTVVEIQPRQQSVGEGDAPALSTHRSLRQPQDVGSSCAKDSMKGITFPCDFIRWMNPPC